MADFWASSESLAFSLSWPFFLLVRPLPSSLVDIQHLHCHHTKARASAAGAPASREGDRCRGFKENPIVTVGQYESLSQNGMKTSCSRSLFYQAVVLDVKMVNFMFISKS